MPVVFVTTRALINRLKYSVHNYESYIMRRRRGRLRAKRGVRRGSFFIFIYTIVIEQHTSATSKTEDMQCCILLIILLILSWYWRSVEYYYYNRPAVFHIDSSFTNTKLQYYSVLILTVSTAVRAVGAVVFRRMISYAPTILKKNAEHLMNLRDFALKKLFDWKW